MRLHSKSCLCGRALKRALKQLPVYKNSGSGFEHEASCSQTRHSQSNPGGENILSQTVDAPVSVTKTWNYGSPTRLQRGSNEARLSVQREPAVSPDFVQHFNTHIHIHTTTLWSTVITLKNTDWVLKVDKLHLVPITWYEKGTSKSRSCSSQSSCCPRK